MGVYFFSGLLCIDRIKDRLTMATCTRVDETTRKKDKEVRHKTNSDISCICPDHPRRLIAPISHVGRSMCRVDLWEFTFFWPALYRSHKRSVNNGDVHACWWNNKKKNKEVRHKTNSDISCICPDHPRRLIAPISHVGLHCINQCTE